jgi:translocation and assembly module TamA
VRREDIAITGPGGQDRYLVEDIAAFKPRVGERFDHVAYEGSKITITRRLADRGYFDADFTQRRVEVTRAEHAADIFLTWDSGRRYDMGPVTFHQDYFRPGLLDPLVYWDGGSYFHQGKLDRLRESLNKLDYFSQHRHPARPGQGRRRRVPVDVNLTRQAQRLHRRPELRQRERAGRGGLERRYINARAQDGHPAGLGAEAQERVHVPHPRLPLAGWLVRAGRSFYDEQTDYIDLRNMKLRASRSGQLDHNWTLIASLNMLRERWRYYSDGDATHQFTSEVCPEISADYVAVDDRLFPRRAPAPRRPARRAVGHRLGRQLRPAVRHAALVPARRRQRPSDPARRRRHHLTGDLVGMPPSLRFFAGGDRSIRGYAWREVGPRNADKYALGAKHVVTGTAEYEHYFGGGPWGAAAFVDTGSAFDNSIDLHTGIGFGVHAGARRSGRCAWMSPTASQPDSVPALSQRRSRVLSTPATPDAPHAAARAAPPPLLAPARLLLQLGHLAARADRAAVRARVLAADDDGRPRPAAGADHRPAAGRCLADLESGGRAAGRAADLRGVDFRYGDIHFTAERAHLDRQASTAARTHAAAGRAGLSGATLDIPRATNPSRCRAGPIRCRSSTCR